MKTHYQRRLPHILPPGGSIFFTFRLAGSVPATAMQQLAAEQELAIRESLHKTTDHSTLVINIKKQQFAKFDALLDGTAQGPTWLREPAIADLMIQEIERLADLAVVVLAYCLMPNHVHLLAQLPDAPDFSAARMMQRLKGRTALAANKLLRMQGQAFWQKESYDHLVRDGKEAERVIAYILNNPVKAGLVDEWTKWPYSFVSVG